MALTLTDRIIIAIAAADKKVFSLDDLAGTMDKFKESWSTKNAAMVLSRDFRQRGWVERIGKIGPLTTYSATLLMYQENYSKRHFILAGIAEKTVVKDIQKKWQRRLDGMKTQSFNPPRINNSKEDAPKAAPNTKRFDVSTVNISRTDLIKAFVASKIKGFSTKEIYRQVVQETGAEKLPEWAVFQPIGKFKKNGWIALFDKTGQTPIYKTTQKFFKDHQEKKTLFCAAIPRKEDKINYNFEYSLTPDEPEAIESDAAENEVSASSKDSEDNKQSAPIHPSGINSDADSIASEIFSSESRLPATYIIGKAVVDYLSMIGFDAVPSSAPSIQLVQGAGDEGTTEIQHELMHQIEQSTKDLKAMVTQVEALKSKNRLLDERLAQALRERASLKNRCGQLTTAIEKLDQKTRTRQNGKGGNGNGKEIVPDETRPSIAHTLNEHGSDNGVVLKKRHTA